MNEIWSRFPEVNEVGNKNIASRKMIYNEVRDDFYKIVFQRKETIKQNAYKPTGADRFNEVLLCK